MPRPSVKTNASRYGALGFLAVALGCAALAAFAVGNTMKSSYSGTRVTAVVVARAELRAGQPIDGAMLEVREWPEAAVPAGAFATIESLLEANKGAAPTVGILPGEPVVAGRLSSSKSGTGVAGLVAPKMRAIAIAVDAAAGYTGLLSPGAYVDVVATMRDPGGRGPSARIAVQHARVLSVGMDTDVATRRVDRANDGLDKTADRGTFVTLEVSPEDAEVLSVARTEGRIDVVLRNATDDAIVDTQGARPEQFSAFVAEPEKTAAVEPTPTTAPARAPTVTRDKRRIQVVASDRADAPTAAKTSGTIEVLNAK